MPIDIPAPLPPCVEVVSTMRAAFREWKIVGVYHNQGVEVYGFKLEDTGDGATYTRLMFTPSRADLAWGIETGWKVLKEAFCDRDGVRVYSMMLTTTVKEKV